MNKNISQFRASPHLQNQRPEWALRVLPMLIAGIFGSSAHAAAPAANALPVGAQVVSGAAAITQNGAALQIQQTSQKMIANWQSFDIGKNASVQFIQPNASAVALNRVLSGDPTQIFGVLRSNGQVFLINPAGIVFGASARVDVGGLMASTHQMSNEDFLSGKYQLDTTNPLGKIQNFGQLVASQGGYVTLVSNQVENGGQILAPGGQVVLAAGDSARLNLGVTGLVGVDVKGGEGAARIDNTGLVAADGGSVYLTAKSAAPMLASAVNQSGVVRANSVALRNGEIHIEAEGGLATVAGTVQADGLTSGSQGGLVTITGKGVQLTGSAVVSADGAAGGGEVLIGGGWQGKDLRVANAQNTFVNKGASISASATEKGDGGTVVLWSDNATGFSGNITATGAGTGQGGRVETSSKGALGVNGTVQTGGGSWLLDPSDITVVSSGGDEWWDQGYYNPNWVATPQPMAVSKSSIESSLNAGTDVTLQSYNTITVNADISKISGGNATMTFAADGNITVNNAISSIAGRLNLNFGANAAQNGGLVTLNNSLATNGGNINFFKNTRLAHATPISTKITQLSSGQSGNVEFYGEMELAAPGYSVTINTQGPQSGANYTGRGGDVYVHGNIYSQSPDGLPRYPQALTIDTTGANTANPYIGPGSITLGQADAGRDIGGGGVDGTYDLRSLTLRGPMDSLINAKSINIFSTSGDVITLASNLKTGTELPRLLLGATDTVINIRGGTYGSNTGYTDYVQSTFDIARSVAKNGVDQTLTINSDRSIKMRTGTNIDGTMTNDPDRGFGLGGSDAAVAGLNNAEGRLTVNLNPFQATAAVGGGIVMDRANIYSNGGDINLGSSGRRATGFGADAQLQTDGIYLTNAKLDSRVVTYGVGEYGDGSISLYGAAPLTTDAGSGVRMVGALTNIQSGYGNIVIDGNVSNFAASGNKDAVIIGEGGSSRVTIQSGSGSIAIKGDARMPGVLIDDITGGSRYNGVNISSRALVSTDSGAITIEGWGGGYDKFFISENHGVKFADTDTSVVSNSGNILIKGTSGGKTSTSGGANSFGIYAAGANMYVGSGQEAYDADTKLLAEGPTASGVVTMVGDSMNFVNTASTHLKVASSGELRMHTENANTKIEFGTAGGLFDPVDLNQKTLYLGSNWFNGSANGVFQPGFRNIVVGNAVTNHAVNTSTGLVGTTGNTNSLTVASATILRDETVLETTGAGGNIKINQDISVGSTSAFDDKALTLHTDSGAVGAGSIKTNQLTLLGAGQQVLTGSNLVNKLAADVNGNISLRNLKTLEIGETTVKGWMEASPNAGETTTTTGVISDNHNVVIQVTGGDINQTRRLNADKAQVLLSATRASSTGGKIYQSDEYVDGVITAGSLQLYANNGVELAKTNQISGDGTTAGGLAANVTAGNLVLKNNRGLNLINGTVAVPTASSTATVSNTDNSISGVTASSTNAITRIDIVGGDLTQAAGANLVSDNLGVTLNGQVALTNTGNQIRNLAISNTGANKMVDVHSSLALTVGSVTANSGLTDTVNGITTSNGNVRVSSAASLEVDQSVAAGMAQIRLQALGGDLTQNEANGTGKLTANDLQAYASGTVYLANRTNNVNTLSGRANTGYFTYTDAADVTVSNATAVTASTKNSGAPAPYSATGYQATTGVSAPLGVRLSAVTGNLQLDSTVNASTGYAHLVAEQGWVAQAPGGAAAQLTAGTAMISAKTGIDMRNNGNDVGTLAAQVTGTGNLAFFDSNGLTVGQVTGVALNSGNAVNPLSGTAGTLSGVKTTNGSVQLKAIAGNLNVNEAVNSGLAHTLLESTAGTLQQNSAGNITANQLLARAKDGVVLNVATNKVTTLAGETTGDHAAFSFTNTQTVPTPAALTVGTANSGTDPITGVNTGSTVIAGASGIKTKGGVVTVSSNGTLNVTQAVLTNSGFSAGANANLTSTAGNIALGADVNAGTDSRISLSAATGAISQSAGGLIGDKVEANALGNVTLTSATNAINTLAAKTTGVDRTISFTNSQSLTVGDAGSTSGVTTNSGDITLTTTAGALNLAKPVNAGDAVAKLLADGNLTQDPAGTITAGDLLARSAGGSVTLKNDANRFDRLAGTAPLGFAAYDSVSLEVGTVAGINGVTANHPHSTLARVDIQSRGGDLTLTQPVVGNGTDNTWSTTDGTGNAAVILRATGRFYNDVGSNAISAPNGRWLVYDNNPLLLDKGMNGLVRDHLIPNTRYGDLLPTSVREAGDAYITTAEYVTPAQLSRSVGGNAMGENFTHTSNSSAGSMSPVFKGDPATQIQRPAQATINTSMGFVPEWPVVIMVQGPHFQSSLASLAGVGAIESATLADGQPLPAWLKLDANERKLMGSVPASTRGAVPLKLKVRDPGTAQPRELQLRLQVSMAN